MSSTFYLPRTLNVDDKTYSEAALLAASRLIVVLAEPGAGKTQLMESLAQQLGTSVVTANRFAHTGSRPNGSALLIDAYDELAKVDASGIYKLLATAYEANPSSLVISSRSSEWDYAATHAVNEFFGERPLLVRLLEFSEDEQRRIFEHHAPSEDFSAFQAEVARFDLEALLPNPQFLNLFADAYIQSGRSFTDKRTIFSQAVERLAKEANATVKTASGSPSTAQKVGAASEVFAKLLLSGAEGVTTSEANEDGLYPYLGSLVEDAKASHAVLSTRMFKPGDTADTHRPVHKIVAEYLAADYLTKRAANPPLAGQEDFVQQRRGAVRGDGPDEALGWRGKPSHARASGSGDWLLEAGSGSRRCRGERLSDRLRAACCVPLMWPTCGNCSLSH